MFRYASLTSPAMLATKWHSNHAVCAKILVIKLPQLEQFVHDYFLLSATANFRHVTGVSKHADGIEICADAIEKCKENV